MRAGMCSVSGRWYVCKNESVRSGYKELGSRGAHEGSYAMRSDRTDQVS